MPAKRPDSLLAPRHLGFGGLRVEGFRLLQVATNLRGGWKGKKRRGDFVVQWHKHFSRGQNLAPNPPLMFAQEKLGRQRLALREWWALNLVRPEAEVALRQ